MLPNAVDESFFALPPSEKKAPPVLLCVGAVCRRKNQNAFIRALEDGYVCLHDADFVRRRRGDTVEQRALGAVAELRTLLVERFGLPAGLELDSIEPAGRYR